MAAFGVSERKDLPLEMERELHGFLDKRRLT